MAWKDAHAVHRIGSLWEGREWHWEGRGTKEVSSVSNVVF